MKAGIMKMSAICAILMTATALGACISEPSLEPAANAASSEPVEAESELVEVESMSTLNAREDFVCEDRGCYNNRRCEGRPVGYFVHSHNCRQRSGKGWCHEGKFCLKL
jgi:hypothetical protein